MPGSSFARKSSKLKKGRSKKKRRGNSDYEEEDEYGDEEELEGFTRTTGRQREFIRLEHEKKGS